MKEWTRQQWQDALQTGEQTAFYLYTPMCGTCAVASKMMDIIEQLLPNQLMGKANLNYMEQLAYDLQIESVPCLIIAEHGEIQEKIYAFQSVPFLYDLLSKSH